MVTTRRQSNLGTSVHEGLATSSSKGDVAVQGVATGASSGAKGESQLPAAKRRKTTKGSSATATGSGAQNAVKAQTRHKGRKDLSLVLTMPLDVVYEILSHLLPTDLFNVAKANRSWRKIVLGPQAGLVWKAARLSVEACPVPPENFTELKWASFLFGSACQSCGCKTSYDLRDWRLLRRACPACKRRHLVDERLVTERRFPGLDKDILKWVPYTADSGWDWKPNQPKQFFWDEDIKRIAAQYAEVQDPQARIYWGECRVATVKKRDELLKVYQAWQGGIIAAQRKQEVKDRITRLDAFKARFVAAGYTPQDVDRALYTWTDGIYYGTPNVTNAVWTRVRPKLEPKVQGQVNARLAAELRPTVDNRMKTLEGVYTTYLDTLRPSERLYCPPVTIFHPIPAILKVLEASKETNITARSFQSFKGKFKKYIADHQAKVKESLKSITDSNQGKVKYAGDPWDLARFVYRRCRALRRKSIARLDWANPEDSILVGWPMIGTHATLERRQHQLRDGVWIPVPAGFDPNLLASLLSVQLIEMAGLDPESTTVAQMDARDARFVHTGFLTEVGYPVLTWKSALALHDAFQLRVTEESEHFRLATPEEEAQAREGEAHVRAAAKAWSCNHCPEFLEASDAEAKSFIVDHLALAHGISQPSVPEDYFVNERCRHAYEVPVEFPTPDRNIELFKCRCHRCRQNVVEKRRFTAEGLLEHYLWMRGQAPVLGVDYVAVGSESSDSQQSSSSNGGA